MDYLALTFSQSTGLKVKVDCQLVASDMAGSERFYVETDFQQFANILVGQSNDLPLDLSFSDLAWNGQYHLDQYNDLPLDVTTSGAAVWKLTHADAVYTKTECDALIGTHRSSSSSSSFNRCMLHVHRYAG